MKLIVVNGVNAKINRPILESKTHATEMESYWMNQNMRQMNGYDVVTSIFQMSLY